MSLVSEPTGRVLGNRYRLIAALGTGASAHVYLAEDLVLQRRVAVKVLQPALAADETFLRRFRAEARSVAALNHPHVLRVFDWGEDADGPFLVLEYLAGGTLRDLLAAGYHLSPAQAARVGAQAAEGLAYAHSRGLVHRDVKPANLLFDEEGRVRVADFGVARALSAAEWTEPAGTMVGTARYASPEQAQGQPADGRSDVYSLGLVLFEAVTGEVPFVADTPLATLRARIGVPLPHHPALGPLDDLLAWATACDLAVRPEASRLAHRLGQLADALPSPAPLPLQAGAGTGRWYLPTGKAEGMTAPHLGLVPGDAPTGAVATTGVLPAGGATGRFAPAPPGQFAPGESGTGVPTASFTAAFPPAALADDTAEPHAVHPGRSPRRRRRRRWPWAVVVLALVALLIAGGLVYAIRTQLFTPSHPVPALVGHTLAEARQRVTADHFHLVVAHAVYSITVAKGTIVRQRPGTGSRLKEGASVTVVPSAGLPNETVPSLLNVNCTGATRLLEQAHLKAATCPALLVYTANVPAGYVINWSYNGTVNPTAAPYGSTIAIAISKGKPPVLVPSLLNDDDTQATGALKALGLSAKEVQAYSTTVPTGYVISTTPPTGTTVPYGASVTVMISKGPHLVTVPNVDGETIAAATTKLQKAGLTVGVVYGPAAGKVFTQNPAAGTQARAGSAVTLYTK